MLDYDVLDYIKRYEVGRISDHGGRETILVTNDITAATECYENLVNNVEDNSKFHVKIFLFDYDKNCNLNYYDSISDSV